MGTATQTVDVSSAHAAAIRGAATTMTRERSVRSFSLRPLLVALGIVAAIIALYGPLRDMYVAWRTGMELEARYEQVVAENSELKQNIDYLMTREGIEDTARTMGYVSPGETAVVVRGAPEDAEPESEQDAAEELPWYIGPLDVIFSYGESA